jgi:septal ring-binding cell division protein DamX
MTPLKRRTKPKPMAEPSAEKPRRPVGLIGAVIAIVIVALILMFQDEINRLYSQKDSEAVERIPERTVSTLAIPPLDEEKPISEAASAIDSATEEKPPPAADNDEDVLIAGDRLPSNQNAASKTLASGTPTAQDSPRSAPNHNDQPALVLNIHLEPWLLDQISSNYTLQLVAGYQKSTVNNFLNRHKLPATELAYYRSVNKGKEWHSLVFGIYPDYSSAKRAIDGLPAAVRKTKPWIRRLKNIQKEINEAADETMGN